MTVAYQIAKKQFSMVNLTIKGIGNLNLYPVPLKRVHPMIARLLLIIRLKLDMSDSLESSMCFQFTTFFFLPLRKSNVTADRSWMKKIIRRKHYQRTIHGYLFHTKTIQGNEICLQFLLFKAGGSCLCPV